MTRSLTNRHRHSTRLEGYDYTQAGAYFVTICTFGRECLFGEVVEGDMRVNELGEAVGRCWEGLPAHFANLELDEFVVMPNHVHGLIVLTSTVVAAQVGAQHAAPLPGPSDVSKSLRPTHSINVKSGSLGAVVRSFKSAVTKRLHELQPESGLPIWQRNYYDHIIRNERDLNAIRRYIYNNPLQWTLDRDNPANEEAVASTGEIYLREAVGEN